MSQTITNEENASNSIMDKDRHEVMIENAASSIDPAVEKRVRMKQDLFLLPMLFLMFYIAYLVRVSFSPRPCRV